MMHSLRERLLWWLLLPLAVFVLIAGTMGYQTARQTADLVQDNALMASARTIGEDVEWRDGILVADVPPAALEMFESPEQDQVFYKVVAGHDRLLAGNPELALPTRPVTQPVYYDTTLDGLTLRAVAYERQLYDSGTTENVTVVVGKTQASRETMMKALWHPQLVRLILMLVLAMVLVYLGLTFELRPLMKLKDDVADREPMELEPIHTERLHFELRPIVDAINQCIARLNLHAATQRQFIADAAHQLRTPIAVLDTQIQCARQLEAPDAQLSEALVCMQRSSRKMANVTDKLLLLAQAESAQSSQFQERVDMATIVSGVFEELIVIAQQRQIDLGADLAEDAVVTGSESLMSALVMNLVDNAIRYTQIGGCVTTVCRREDGEVVLEVIDNGPGIPAEARSHVFERFYRGAADGDGTGLGLSIVKEIVQSHGGTIALASGQGGKGLTAIVRLQAYRD